MAWIHRLDLSHVRLVDAAILAGAISLLGLVLLTAGCDSNKSPAELPGQWYGPSTGEYRAPGPCPFHDPDADGPAIHDLVWWHLGDRWVHFC